MQKVAKEGRIKKIMADISSGFVIFLGMATTFFGLICIIILAKIMSFCCKIANKTEAGENSAPAPAQAQAPKAAPASEEIPNRGEFVAAISAAIAEEMGADVSSIRILSIKKI